MGIDFGAMLCYGVPLIPDYASDFHVELDDIYEILDKVPASGNLEIVIPNSYGDSDSYVAIKETVRYARYGRSSIINFEIIQKNSWATDLYQFCHDNGYVYSEPSWYLAVTMS